MIKGECELIEEREGVD